MKVLKYLILIFFLINCSYAISLSDLLNSYDFSYKDSFVKINFENISLYNNTYTYFVNVNLIGGDYVIDNYITSNLNSSLVFSKNFILNNGDNVLNFSFDKKYLLSGEYSIGFEILNNGKLVYRNNSLNKINIVNSEELEIVKIDNMSIMFNLNLTEFNSSLIEIQTENGIEYLEAIIENDIINFNLPSKNLIEIKKIIFSNENNKFILKTDKIIKNVIQNETINNNTFISDLTLSDLIISNFSYDNVSGESFLNISNIGEGDAIYFDLKIIDGNFNFVFEKKINYLLSNTSLNYNFNLSSNLSSVYIFIDYYNSVDELNEDNNLFIWPIEEETILNLTEKIIFDKIKDKNGIKREFKINESLKGKILNLTYDFGEKKAKLKFLDFNTSSNLNKTIKIDLYENTNNYLTVLGVNSSYNFSNVSVTLSYNKTLVKNESKLRLMYCSKYDYDNRECSTSFVDISNRATFNFSSGEVEFTTGSFSAYAITEYEEVIESNNVQSSSGRGKNSQNGFVEIIEKENNEIENVSLNNESEIKNYEVINSEDSSESKNEKLFSEDNFVSEFFNTLKVENRPSNTLTGNIIINSEFGWLKLIVGTVIISILVFVFG